MLRFTELHHIYDFAVLHWKAISGFITAVGILPVSKLPHYLRTILDRRNLMKKTGADLYTRGDLVRSLSNYVKPYCQSIDPSGGEDFRHTVAVKQDAHKHLKDLLDPTKDERLCLLLADSGMGKTTLLLNFFARHIRKSNSSYALLLVPLGSPRADAAILNASDKSNTVLLLDAFDEDTEAVSDHRERLTALLQLSQEFAKVLITCRTQFFERDDEIPRETGLARFGIRGPGQPATFRMRKVYLSPFDEDQIKSYLKLLFPIWRIRERAQAKAIANRMGDLTARPMLLAHIKDLIVERRNYSRTSEIYAAMIDAWLQREGSFVDPRSLRTFSEALARKMYLERQARGTEPIPRKEAVDVALKVGVILTERQLGARSLLNRDAEGNVKFSHRSILEFLFICDFMRTSPELLERRSSSSWTDQMKRFWWDLVDEEFNAKDAESFGVNASELVNRGLQFGDVSGFFNLRLKPIVKLRAAARTASIGDFSAEMRDSTTHNLTHKYRTRQFHVSSKPELQGTMGMRR